MKNIQLAVITGGHTFEVPPFHRLFSTLPGIDAYIQTLEDWGADVGGWRGQYDVILFYNMHSQMPDAHAKGVEKKVRAALEGLKETRQGVVLLHHALLAFPEWNFWSDLAGMPDRKLARYDHDQMVSVHVSAVGHPITNGVQNFEILDETYQMQDAAPENEILLSTDDPNSLQTLAWVRRVNQAPVFCLALGHDHQSWENTNFQKILQQGITWAGNQ
jgi:type 1 glutamine amidotransferase